jgi:hypothetical protein
MAAKPTTRAARKHNASPYSTHPSFSMRGAEYMADRYDPEALVEAIFSGNKAHLRPFYEEILQFGLGVADDVKVCPCATIIPFYRKHVIAQVRVPNRSRIDLGFELGDMKPVGRLIDTGGFRKKDRITHRIEISSPQDFNDEPKKWFRRAYERDAPN